MDENAQKDNPLDRDENKDSFPPVSRADLTEAIGTRIGPYTVLSVLGEGGFGIVYLAEQKKPVRRQVALKVIKPGMDSKQVIARFEAEEQALALLDHPNIAHVFDAGTTDKGWPYFAMEYVKGPPLRSTVTVASLPLKNGSCCFCKSVRQSSTPIRKVSSIVTSNHRTSWFLRRREKHFPK